MKKIVFISIFVSTFFIRCSDDNGDPTVTQINADFTTDKTEIAAGETVTFTDISSGNPSEWNWTFEEGNPATSKDQNPKVIFNSAGVYSVTLIANNSESEDTITKDDLITVENELVASFISSDSTIKVGETISFTDLSLGNPIEWSWEFSGGDPETSTDQNPSVTYNSPGTFKVSLKVSDGNNENQLEVEGLIIVKEDLEFQLNEHTTFGLSVRSDFMQSIVLLEDNSVVSTGWTDNENTSEQETNILVAKFDQDLNLVWNNVIGGSNSDLVRDIISTKDGGFLLSASTQSNDGDISENNGASDIGIIKLNSSGNIDWIKIFGGSNYDGVNNNSILELENGYAFIGYIESEDAGVSGKIGKYDIWIAELDLEGNITNYTIMGSTENDFPYSFVSHSNGYTILSKIGAVTSDFDSPGIWVFHSDLDGNITWKTMINGLNAGKLIKTLDGGFISVNTNSDNISDLMVTKLGSQGSVEWEDTYPMSGQEFAEDIIELNNEYIILGSSEPAGNDPRQGFAYLAKINSSGRLIHSILFGEEKTHAARVVQMQENQFIVGGTKNISDSYIDSEFLIQKVTESNK